MISNDLEDKLVLDDLHFDEQEDKQTQREIRIVELKLILQQQMNQMKKIEQELESLKQQQEHLLHEQTQLNQYEQQIKQLDKSFFQQDSSRQLLRQHKAKIHKRAKQIQEQLEFHLEHLQSFVKRDQQSHFQTDLIKLIKRFQNELTEEKHKEEEFESMYQEELAKQWSSHELTWNQQVETRDKLIEQFLNQRQTEIQDKLSELKQQIDDSSLQQQILIQEMEQARKYQLIEKQKQISDRQQPKQVFQQNISRPIIEEDQPIEQKQKTTIPEKTVESKFYGRRRVNWN